ncbi:MAG: hypothetical protein ACYTGC_10255 [Planctomycetota bacterium]|jgi:hypothetical protein
MGHPTGATDTQKTLLVALGEGWLLRHIDGYGWCLFRAGRERPFAKVKNRTVDAMTEAGWLTPGVAIKGLGYRPAKDLTKEGRRYAERLIREEWAEQYHWDPVGPPPRRGFSDPNLRIAA